MSIGSSLGIFMTFIEHLSTFKFVLHSCSVWEKMHSTQENSLHFFKRHFYTTTIASHENSAENKSWLFPSYFRNSTHKMTLCEDHLRLYHCRVHSVQTELIVIWKVFRFYFLKTEKLPLGFNEKLPSADNLTIFHIIYEYAFCVFESKNTWKIVKSWGDGIFVTIELLSIITLK